jgi:hypothetical protein
MVYLPPYAASLALLGSLTAGDFLDFTALAVLVAGVFVVARYRAALGATDASAKAWHEERDAALSRAERLAADLVIERAETASLKARPDMDAVVVLLETQEKMLAQAEENADRRTQQIVKAINGGLKGGAT